MSLVVGSGRDKCVEFEALGGSTGAKTMGLGHLPFDAQAPKASKLGNLEFVAYYCLFPPSRFAFIKYQIKRQITAIHS